MQGSAAGAAARQISTAYAPLFREPYLAAPSALIPLSEGQGGEPGPGEMTVLQTTPSCTCPPQPAASGRCAAPSQHLKPKPVFSLVCSEAPVECLQSKFCSCMHCLRRASSSLHTSTAGACPMPASGGTAPPASLPCPVPHRACTKEPVRLFSAKPARAAACARRA